MPIFFILNDKYILTVENLCILWVPIKKIFSLVKKYSNNLSSVTDLDIKRNNICIACNVHYAPEYVSHGIH